MVLLFARSDASEERMNEIAKEIGGEIVGKISGIHQYQIEVSSMSRESLENVCEKATGFDEIKFAIVVHSACAKKIPIWEYLKQKILLELDLI